MFDTALVEHLICIKCGATSLRFEGGNSEGLLTCPKCGENYQTNSNFADFASNLNLKRQKEWEKTLNEYENFLGSFRAETIRTNNLLRESMRAKKKLVELSGFSGRILDIGGKGFADVTILSVPEVNFSFVLPLICFIVIAIFGFRTSKIHGHSN